MPVKLYQETDVTKKISHLTFCMESAESIEELSHVQVVTDELYDVENKRAPVRYGLLDPRMGVSQKNVDCETCGKNISDCNGHFGYLDLNVPLYHTGFFGNIITILQSICKRCSHVLLIQKDKDKYVRSLSNPHLSYFQKKVLRQVIIKKCKKSRTCLNCTYVNGIVKKFVSSGGNSFNKFGIVHVKPEKDKECREKLEQYNEHFKITTDVEPDVVKSLASEVLTPVGVLNLFKNIPESDIIFLCMNSLRSRPEDLIMTKMLVPPVCVRPSVASTLREGTMEDHLTAIQQEILYFNREFVRSKSLKITPGLYNDRVNELQLKTATFFNGEISGIPLQYKVDKRKGLQQRLSGKNGRFRGNLSGKRVNFSARTVISPDPNLEIDQVGVPVHIAKILTFTDKVNKINISKMRQLVINGPDQWPGANYIIQKNGATKFLRFVNRQRAAQDLREGDAIERHMANDDMVLMNRQPSLHRLSIMAHRVKVHFHRTFRINECVCNPYNADFDGDEMNLHLPQTIEAKAEAYGLLNIKNNLITPKNGEILIAATQDFLSGAFAITRKDRFYTFRQVNQLLCTLLGGDDINMNIDIPEPAILKPKRLWTGKQMFGLILRPNKECTVKVTLEVKGKSYTGNREFCRQESYIIIRNSEILAGSLDKSHLGSGGRGENIFYILFKDFNADYSIKCMWRLARMASYHLMNTAGFSIGIGDVMPNEKLIESKNALLEKGYDDCHNFIEDKVRGRLQCQPGCSVEETLESKLLKTLSDIRDNAGKVCLRELHPTNSPLIMALCGSKGSNINISQMVACVGQQALNGERVPFSFDKMSLPQFFSNSIIPSAKGFVKNSFFSGMVPSEFFFHTMGGREGLVDTAVKTAESGYMQRRLIKALEDLVVCHDKTVRNADKQIVQLLYGNDGLDPAEMETSKCPVDFNRILYSVKAQKPCRNEVSLDKNEICIATKQFEMDFLQECDEVFKAVFCEFMENLAERVGKVRKQYDSYKISAELERVTATQLVTFASICRRKYKSAIIEAGTAVGAVAAQSIGEPGTQMTLKTFHFAGVASMNITQGVPRIKEIINASKSISTPIITTPLLNPTSKTYAARVKARLEKTTLKEISHFEIVIEDDESFLKIVLNANLIQCLSLEINAHTIRYNICKAKLKILPQDVIVKSSRVLLVRPSAKEENNISNAICHLQEKLQNVIIKGLPTASRVVTAQSDNQFFLYVEGSNMREIMATYGVNGHSTTSNNIIEVYETLGIEAARNTIVLEIEEVLKSHGMSVDIRHIMLLATQMTRSGAVLGITRTGLAKMNQSVLTLASFEKTTDHLYDAAYYGRTDAANGVSENIIMGMPVPVGTSALKLISTPGPQQTEDRFANLPLLFEEN